MLLQLGNVAYMEPALLTKILQKELAFTLSFPARATTPVTYVLLQI